MKYYLDILSDTWYLGTKLVSTLADPSIKRFYESDTGDMDIQGYKRLIGCLLYLTTTRPDITFITQQLSQFINKPSTIHFNASTRVLWYLKQIPTQGLFFPRDSSLHLTSFSDADWEGCIETRRFILGQCVFLGKSLISWRTKKQLTSSRSYSENE